MAVSGSIRDVNDASATDPLIWATPKTPATAGGHREYTGFLLRRAQQAHVAAWQQHVSLDVSSVQFGVLSVLYNQPGASQVELCGELDLDRSTIADIVVRLERRGLLQRLRHSTDRRRNVLALTEAGQAQLAELLPRVGVMDAQLTSRLTGVEVAELRALVARLIGD